MLVEERITDNPKQIKKWEFTKEELRCIYRLIDILYERISLLEKICK